MRFKTSYEPAIISGLPRGLRIEFSSQIADFILHELRRHPGVEEGGKYIGYIDVRSHSRSTQITVTDFLPGGPLAKRTSVEFMPDGEFQEKLFRHAEQRDHAVEHVGSWHSHHCNGLRQLSGGDIRGYFKTLAKAAYRPPVFIASLVKEIPNCSTDKGWIDHFLFVKGEEDRFYKITDEIETINVQSRFGDITGHEMTPSSSGDSDFWYQTEKGAKPWLKINNSFVVRWGLLPRRHESSVLFPFAAKSEINS
jgi:hypothetical protein